MEASFDTLCRVGLVGISGPGNRTSGGLCIAAWHVDNRQLGGDLHAAPSASIQAGVEHIGAHILIAIFDEREMGFPGIQST